MTKLKVGDVGYMKLTGEPAFVIWIDDHDHAPELGPVVVVRLTGGGSGQVLTYPQKDVYLAELESLEERASRDFQETQRLKKLADGLMAARDIKSGASVEPELVN